MGQVVARIKSLGGNLQYVQMDEPLYFGHESKQTNAPQYSISEVARQVAVNVAAIEAVFPNVQIGDTEPVPIASDIMQWAQAYQLATGHPLTFFNADVGWNSQWQGPLEDLAESLREANISFGVIYTGNNATRDADWIQTAITRIATIESDPLLRPDSGILATWTNNPTHALPDNDPNTLSYLGLVYDNLAPLFRDGTLSPLTNDAPWISAPADVSAPLGSQTPIPTITVGLDRLTPPNTNVVVMLTDATGLIYAADAAGVTGSGTTSLTLSGSIARVNIILATLSYVGRTPGTDSLQVTSIDGVGAPGQNEILLHVGTALAQVTPADLQFSTSMEFVRAADAGTILQGTGKPDVFDLTGNANAQTQILWFDPTQDIIEVFSAMVADFTAIVQKATATSGGALISLDAYHTVLVVGVAPESLQAANFAFV